MICLLILKLANYFLVASTVELPFLPKDISVKNDFEVVAKCKAVTVSSSRLRIKKI